MGSNRLLTFGGAFSNHIYATAAAAFESGMSSIGIIRGEEPSEANATLQFASHHGMELHFVSREAYRKKTDPAFITELKQRFGSFFLIPEGGTNHLAVKGCAEFAEEKLGRLEFDHLFLAVGTGGTMAGIICGFKGSRNITGVPVLKNGSFLESEVNALVLKFSKMQYRNWALLTEYHHGGYAKTTPALLDFMTEMQRCDIPLDHVYTAKVLWAIIQEAERGNFSVGEKVLMLHTGGLQGRIKLP